MHLGRHVARWLPCFWWRILEHDSEEMDNICLDGPLLMARLKYHIELICILENKFACLSWNHICYLFADGNILKVIDGAHLDCVVKTHPSLNCAMHLLPENALVSGKDNIPGLIPSPTGTLFTLALRPQFSKQTLMVLWCFLNVLLLNNYKCWNERH